VQRRYAGISPRLRSTWLRPTTNLQRNAASLRRASQSTLPINAAGAVCGVRLGRRAAGTDHDQVIALLGESGKDGSDVAKDLARLLPLKTKAEYDPDDFPLSTASKAVVRAQRCVAVGRRVVSSATRERQRSPARLMRWNAIPRTVGGGPWRVRLGCCRGMCEAPRQTASSIVARALARPARRGGCPSHGSAGRYDETVSAPRKKMNDGT